MVLSSVSKWVSSKHPSHNAVDKIEAECSAALSVNAWHTANRDVALKSLEGELNRKLCVCVNLMRAFPSTTASYGSIQWFFNAKFVFTIVWIHIFPSFDAKMFLKIRCSQFFLQWSRIRVYTVSTFTQTLFCLHSKWIKSYWSFDKMQPVVCWKRALGPYFFL